MDNLAGKECDSEVMEELNIAGIPVVPETENQRYREPITDIMGFYKEWEFRRSWDHWIAHGPYVKLNGVSNFCNRLGYEFDSGRNRMYTNRFRIDTQTGLNEFKEFIDSLDYME